MQIKEIWKPVKGYEELYEVSDLGRVKSHWYGREKILKPVKTKDGYLQVCLCRNGKVKRFLVHRLVATAFIPNTFGLPEINHKDENPLNNAKFNIEWCDRRYNINYGTRNIRAASARINHPARSKAVEASKYSDFRTIELRFVSTAEAERNGFNQGNVSACCRWCFCREGNNKYRGLYWRFAS